MTTIDTANTGQSPVAGEKAQTDSKACDSPQVKMVSLDQLAREMKIPPRDARMMLRLAAKQKKLYPTLGKEHVARQPWQRHPSLTVSPTVLAAPIPRQSPTPMSQARRAWRPMS